MVFGGYWNNAAASSEALEGGWFHTGDRGALDDDGYLRTTGRKKEMLVTAAGKNVSPAGLEDKLRAHPLLSQCMVVGDRQPFVAALITLDEEFLPGWKAAHGKREETGVRALATDEDLRAELQDASARRTVGLARRVDPRFHRAAEGPHRGSRGITPSVKVRRGVVTEHYAAEIAAIYAE